MTLSEVIKTVKIIQVVTPSGKFTVAIAENLIIGKHLFFILLRLFFTAVNI